MSSLLPNFEVIFVQASAPLEIRLTDITYAAIREAATNLKARWVVVLEQDLGGFRTWAVYDTGQATRDRYGVEFPEPAKRFPVGAKDAAVMYAVMLQGKS